MYLKIVYVKGKYKNFNKIYTSIIELLKEIDLNPNYFGIDSKKGWYAKKSFELEKKEKLLLKTLKNEENINWIELYVRIIENDIVDEICYVLLNKKENITAIMIDKKYSEKVNFEKILCEIKKNIFLEMEEIFEWDYYYYPLLYIKNGEKMLTGNENYKKIYKKYY